MQTAKGLGAATPKLTREDGSTTTRKLQYRRGGTAVFLRWYWKKYLFPLKGGKGSFLSRPVVARASVHGDAQDAFAFLEKIIGNAKLFPKEFAN